MNEYYRNANLTLYQGDCLEILPSLHESSIDMIFADPPYNLSNGGLTCHAGRMVSVNKGEWDTSGGFDEDHQFTLSWLWQCKRVLKNDGTIWVTGTMHNIYSVGFALKQLGYRILNEICWFKPNASPNLSCRYFTHSHETLIWASKSPQANHTFNYTLMKQKAGGKQMRSLWPDINADDTPQDIWIIPTPQKSEKKFGKHPTQKPVSLIERIVLASTNEGDLILDPFTGSSTTGIAALRNNRRFVGIDSETDYLELSVKRLEEETKHRTENPLLIKDRKKSVDDYTTVVKT